MVSVLFTAPRDGKPEELLTLTVEYGQPLKIRGDPSWLDFTFRPISRAYGRPISWEEDCEEWLRALCEAYADTPLTATIVHDSSPRPTSADIAAHPDPSADADAGAEVGAHGDPGPLAGATAAPAQAADSDHTAAAAADAEMEAAADPKTNAEVAAEVEAQADDPGQKSPAPAAPPLPPPADSDAPPVAWPHAQGDTPQVTAQTVARLIAQAEAELAERQHPTPAALPPAAEAPTAPPLPPPSLSEGHSTPDDGSSSPGRPRLGERVRTRERPRDRADDRDRAPDLAARDADTPRKSRRRLALRFTRAPRKPDRGPVITDESTLGIRVMFAVLALIALIWLVSNLT